MSDNALGAANQQGSRSPRRIDPSETTRRPPLLEKRKEILAYLHGAKHDASLNKGNRTRFVQKQKQWLDILQSLLAKIEVRSWIYKEGKGRDLWVLETTCRELISYLDPRLIDTKSEMIAYVRGYFDAEGGIPRNGKRFYVQLVQKNKAEVDALKEMLRALGIESGKVHNPSIKADPNYWRIFISTRSQRRFVELVGSYHPVKARIFQERMMI